jgi:hypothetical protein
MVHIRRWNATTDSFSEWVTGQIVRPIVVENQVSASAVGVIMFTDSP